MVQVWHRVDDVPAAFAALLAERSPASIALSGGETARDCYEAAAGECRRLVDDGVLVR